MNSPLPKRNTDCNCPSSDAALAWLNELVRGALEENPEHRASYQRLIPWWVEHWLEVKAAES
jgi:hypothetical protein